MLAQHLHHTVHRLPFRGRRYYAEWVDNFDVAVAAREGAMMRRSTQEGSDQRDLVATTTGAHRRSLLSRILLLAAVAFVVRTFMRRTDHPIHFPASLEATVSEPLKTDGPMLFSPPEALEPVFDDEPAPADAWSR